MTRTLATLRLCGSILRLVLLAVLVRPLAETLPADEDQAGHWIAGFCWAFAIFWTCVLLVTFSWAIAHGVRL